MSGKLVGSLVNRVIHVVRHPVASGAYAAGLARGLASEGIRLVSGRTRASSTEDRDPDASRWGDAVPADEAAASAPPEGSVEEPATDGPREPQRVGLEPGERLAAEADEPAPPLPDPVSEQTSGPASDGPEAETGESFATEPHAASRASAHGEEGDTDEAAVDRWQEEAEDTLAGEAPPEPVPGSDDEPVLDPGVAKSVRSEAEQMRRAADNDPS